MEQCKDRTKTPMKPKRTTLESIDHYAGIGILFISGCFIAAIGYYLIKSWPI